MFGFTTLKTVVCSILLVSAAAIWQLGQAHSEVQKRYIGSDACKGCHEVQYSRFNSYAKKVHSYDHIKVLKKGLTDMEFQQCLECHTTGYGKPGGFRSEVETPQLKDAGCEVCHGPGSLHAESGDPNDIKGKLTVKDCEACHNSERVEAFHYKPMIYGGAH